MTSSEFEYYMLAEGDWDTEKDWIIKSYPDAIYPTFDEEDFEQNNKGFDFECE